MKRYEGQHEGNSNDRGPTDLLPHEVCDDKRGQWSDPEVVQENDCYVESVHIIGEHVDELTCRRFAERRLR